MIYARNFMSRVRVCYLSRAFEPVEQFKVFFLKMRSVCASIILLVFLTLIFILNVLGVTVSTHPILIVISFDGFRYNYFNKGVTPNLDALRRQNSRAEYMKNVFPTKTFPNHHTIATGLYPESHGVLGNSVFDPNKKKTYGYSAELYSKLRITPIWTLNEKAGKGRHSGVMMWPGSEFEYENIRPTFFKPLDFNISWESRVDTVIEWLTHKSTAANLVMMYFEEPDRRAHAFGPDSDVVKLHIEKLDNITQYLRDQLSTKRIINKINVIQLSDHGMESVTLNRIINITDFMEKSDYEMTDTSPVIQIFPKQGKEDKIYRSLKTASLNSHYNVYRKSEIPTRWHYKESQRAPPLLVVADEGYAFDDMYLAEEEFIRTWNVTPTPDMVFGLHGYDNTESNMRPFFMAWGNVFKKNYDISPFETVDLYPLFCTVLNLQSPKNNGTLSHVSGVLKPKSKL